MSTRNTQQIAPSLPFPERGRNVVDVQLAQNTRRRGPLQAEEGLGWEPPYPGAFHESVMKSDDAANHTRYETQLAGQANGRERLGSGQEVPSWNAVDSRTFAGWQQGITGTEQTLTPQPPQFLPRAGANPGTLSPTAGLRAGERPGTTYSKAPAPLQGGRGRKNQADITEAL